MGMTAFVLQPGKTKSAKRRLQQTEEDGESNGGGQDIEGAPAKQKPKKKHDDAVPGIPEEQQINFEVIGYTENFSLPLLPMEQIM